MVLLENYHMSLFRVVELCKTVSEVSFLTRYVFEYSLNIEEEKVKKEGKR